LRLAAGPRFQIRQAAAGRLQTMKLFIGFPLSNDDRAVLEPLTLGDQVWFCQARLFSAEDRAAFLEAEAVLGFFPEDLLFAAERLRWIQLSSVGVDTLRHIDWLRLGDRVACTNLRGVYAEPMAQTMLAGILAFDRGIEELQRLKAGRVWQKDRLHSRLHVLRGARVLLLGAGSVNTRLRELLAAFGCTFTVYGRTSGDIHSPAELDAALPTADIVCAAMPDAPGTKGLLDAARIARFKDGALFVNVGRGNLVDEAALVAALTAGRLRGALLDVTIQEPLPANDPLWNCPRLILTQHTSAGSPRVTREMLAFFGTNLARYRSGQPLLNVVDWRKGY